MPRSNNTGYAILGVLTLGPSSGYEIVKFCREVLSSFWSESYGQIYPRLAQLVDDGMVRKKEVRGSTRKKALYTITPKGRRAIAAWAVEPAIPQSVRNEMLLKVFFGADLPVEVSQGQIAGFLTAQQEAIGILKAVEKELDGEEMSDRQRVHWRITVRMGIHVMQARIKWARESLAELATLSDLDE